MLVMFVDVFASHKPDNLADLAFGIRAGHPGKSLGVNLFVPCQLGGIVQCCAFFFCKQGARAVCSSASNLALFIDALTANDRPTPMQKRQTLMRAAVHG